MSQDGTICPFCQRTVPAGKDVCPLCGTPIGGAGNVGISPVDSAVSFASAPTLLRMPDDEPPSPPKSPPKSAAKPGSKFAQGPAEPPETLLAAAQNAQRFHPGDLIADRYKIVSIIGKGGMGEVYRATDRTLSQDVALKFLPRRFINDPKAERHLLEEVRLARRVSHRNVCRVHDVEQSAEGLFITMELIEGEDLATIIRRVGRLSGTRAVAIAREICIGLAAAHEQGVIHRDLKPANVLIDKDGHVHLADFGLSALTSNAGKHRGGTPSYMPPEQVLGDPVGPSGDIYCLGLTLFEMFTGKPVFRPKDMIELLELHEQGPPTPSSVEPAIDPIVEQVISRCLERKPEDRPSSALLVAADLPGGSLVAAALDAGLTLSPDMVASAGARRAISRSAAAALFASVVLCMAVIVSLARKVDLAAFVPMDKSADVLADRSRTLLKNLGYSTQHAHEAYAFDYYEQLLSEIAARDPSPHWWQELTKPRPSPIDFWYRRHTRPLVAEATNKKVSWLDPAPEVPGMISLRLDPGGRLRELMVVTAGLESLPEELTDPSLAALRQNTKSVDPLALLEAADLDPDLFAPAPTTWVNPVYCDEVLCYSGVYPDNSSQPITVNMGFFHGWPVSFRIIETRLESASQFKDVAPSWHKAAGNALQLALAAITTIGAAFLARRNIRLERGDRNGAFRLAIAAFVLTFASFLLRADHSDNLEVEASVFSNAVMFGVFNAAMFWVFYLAIEPHARRLWPEALFSWSRLMKDRWTDPMVGLSVLVGIFIGLIAVVVTQTNALSPSLLGLQPDAPLGSPDFLAETLEGGRKGFGVALYFVINAIRFALLYFTGIILIISITKRRTTSLVIYASLHALGWTLVAHNSWLTWGFGIIIGVLAGGLLRRFGLLALAVGVGTCRMLLAFPLELRSSTWYFESSLLSLGLIACLAAFGAAAAAGLLPRKTA